GARTSSRPDRGMRRIARRGSGGSSPGTDRRAGVEQEPRTRQQVGQPEPPPRRISEPAGATPKPSFPRMEEPFWIPAPLAPLPAVRIQSNSGSESHTVEPAPGSPEVLQPGSFSDAYCGSGLELRRVQARRACAHDCTAAGAGPRDLSPRHYKSLT